MKKSNKANYIIIAIFLIFIGFFALESFVNPAKTFSESENRSLQQFPEAGGDAILSGELQNGLENYLKDQIIGRDTWISAKTFVQKAMGETSIGGAYVGKSGYDFEQILPEALSGKIVDTNVQSVHDYLEYAKSVVGEDRVSFLLIPTSGLIMKEKLPKNAILFDQNSYYDDFASKLSDVNLIDTRETLDSHDREYIYYKTDHHWTSLGALYTYQQWMRETKGIEVDTESYIRNIVSDSFKGTLHSKILDFDSAADEIWTYEQPDKNGQFRVVADGTLLKGMFDKGKLRKKNQYEYFFGGNYGETVITGGSGEGNLLVIKDSFANTFVPLIADNYNAVYMIDLRYYTGDMKQYLEDNQITEVLVLYNMSNFIEPEANLYKLMQ